MNYKMLLVLLCLSMNSVTYNMTGSFNSLSVYAIPGQNGEGSSDEYVKDVVGIDVNIIRVSNPRTAFQADLGQAFCMKQFDLTLKSQGKEGIIHASSQGAATALNYLANNPNDKIKALVLEATLVSGNKATLKRVTGRMDFVKRIPLSYYWAPYIAKMLFPFYWPAGKQAIKSIQKIDNNIPVIIVHAQNDPQISHDDACALYYGLRMQGNDNAYFVSKKTGGHLELLGLTPYNREIIPTILRRHNILEGENAVQIDLEKLQPDPAQYRQQYEDLMFKENVHHYGGRLVGLGLVFACLKFVKNAFWPDSPWKELADASFDNFIKNQTRL